LPTPIDNDSNDTTHLTVTLDSVKLYYDPARNTLFQLSFYSVPKTEIVKIVLTDSHGHSVDYKMLLEFRCDSPPPAPYKKKPGMPEPISAKITNITANSNVTITFSKNLTIPKFNLTEFPRLNVTVEGKSVPALDLNIIS